MFTLLPSDWSAIVDTRNKSTTDRTRIFAQNRRLFAKWARVDRFSGHDAQGVRPAH
jgi:hypothetical protein